MSARVRLGVPIALLELMICEEMLLILPFYEGRVPAGFPSPAEDYLETQLDLNDFLVRNKAATFLMRVEGTQHEGCRHLPW